MRGSLLALVAKKSSYKRASPYIKDSLLNVGAIKATERILQHGYTETGDKLKVSKWFKQQIRLTADNRLRHLLTTGASQISKSLVNYLVAIDDLVNGQINIGWVYASRQSLINQQPSQFQAMVSHWGQKSVFSTQRDSVFRYKIGNAIANFTYANSSSEQKGGGSAEGKEQNSFQASKLYYEEKSSWRSNVDMSPRLGAGRIASKPIRELGTPGNGSGIEKAIRNCSHNFEPGLICPSCNNITFLHPLGALIKPLEANQIKNKVTLDLNQTVYFNTRGEIVNFFGSEQFPYVACLHCNADITKNIIDCELYSKQSLQSADEFLDSLEDNHIYYPSISIYLSPLLKVPDDEYRLRDLILDGLDPDVVLIYHQNKLGIESVFTITSITNDCYENLEKLKPFEIDKPLRFVGIDQGTDTHYLVDISTNPKDIKKTNINAVIEIKEDEIIAYLRIHNIDFAIIDGEPGRKSANDLQKQSKGVLALGDQRNIASDISKAKVEYGGIPIDCYLINNDLFKEVIFENFIDSNYRINCITHRKFKKHITSIKRDISTGIFSRPLDHDDDFFFALFFAEAAKTIYLKDKPKPGTSRVLGNKLKQLRY